MFWLHQAGPTVCGGCVRCTFATDKMQPATHAVIRMAQAGSISAQFVRWGAQVVPDWILNGSEMYRNGTLKNTSVLKPFRTLRNTSEHFGTFQ